MNINDTVFLIQPATFHKYLLPNSVQITPVKVDSIRDNSIVVALTVDDISRLLLEVPQSQLYPNMAKALEEVQKVLVKSTTFVSETLVESPINQTDED